MAATPSTDGSPAPWQRHNVPPLPNPASHTPPAPRSRTCSVAAAMSSIHPEREKLPSEWPQPRKLRVRTSQPISVAMRSASSGNDLPDAGDSRPRTGNPWHNTSAGTGPDDGWGSERCADRVSPDDRKR